MSSKYTAVDDALYAYLLAHRSPDDALLRELQAETATLTQGGMQIAPDQGTFLRLVVGALGVKRAIEVGTFTGMSSICIARGLAAGGRLLCCDVSEEFTIVARRYWERAGLLDRIELRLGPALETLRALPREPGFDFAFIDADKASYSAYYEELLPRLRVGGLIAVDNVLWHGAVLDAKAQDADTQAIRRFNDQVAADARVESVMIAIADGLTLARKL